MGLYQINCASCGHQFLWHSSNISQVCGECTKNAGGFQQVEEKINDTLSMIHLVSNNEIDNTRFVLIEKTIDQEMVMKLLENRGHDKNNMKPRLTSTHEIIV